MRIRYRLLLLVSLLFVAGGSAQDKSNFLVLDGLDHDQTALILGDEQNPLTRAILAMIERGSK